MRILVVILSLAFVFINGCATSSSESKIPDEEVYNTLYVQNVNENGTRTDENRLELSDKEKIEKLIHMVEGLETKNATDQDVKELHKELRKPNTYTFTLSENSNSESRKYIFTISSNGYLYLTDANNSVKSITTEEHPNLLHTVKKELNIDI
ncbi:hypothetical protein EQV77_14930 [Halobacillus fulvus]|nr:hypothetical protein EQV77_14930 [Halobacillus fulvus]